MADTSGAHQQHRFDEPHEAPEVPPSPGSRLLLGAGAGAGLLGALLAAWGGWAAATLLVVAAALVAAGLWLRRAAPAPARRPLRGLVLRGRELLFDDASGGALRPIGRLGERFGVTVLANRARSRAALALTSSESAFFVGASVLEHESPRCRALLSAAFTVASDERALEPAAPDGLPLVVGGEALARLYERLLQVDDGCAGRLFLTDVRGEQVFLDSRALRVGPCTFDLTSALDWQGQLFQEVGHNGLTIYQATQVRQGSSELVFVSLMQALSSPGNPGDLVPSDALLETVAQRDLALLHDTFADPPPVHQRVAIDRVFMLPLRAALQASPRSHRQRSSTPSPLS